MAHESPYPVSAHYRPPQGSYPPPPSPFHAPYSQGSYPPPQAPYPQVSPFTGASYPAPPRPAGASRPRGQSRQVLLGGSMLALAALVITPQINRAPNGTQSISTQGQSAASFTCFKQENPQALVSRDQVKKLLETDLQASRATVREALKTPYCVLSAGKTEAGEPADREAYPLEFDPDTWLVVLYEGDRYIGYDFRFR
jgi:hypothetical protein